MLMLVERFVNGDRSLQFLLEIIEIMVALIELLRPGFRHFPLASLLDGVVGLLGFELRQTLLGLGQSIAGFLEHRHAAGFVEDDPLVGR